MQKSFITELSFENMERRRHTFLKLQISIPIFKKRFGGEEVAGVIAGDFFVFFVEKKLPHLIACHFALFWAGDSKGAAKKMKRGVFAHSAVISELIGQIHMARNEFLG